MNHKTMTLLVEIVDEINSLDEALKNLTRMGYHERFPKLDNVYDIIKQNSIYSVMNEDDEYAFFDFVDDKSMTCKERAYILLGIKNPED